MYTAHLLGLRRVTRFDVHLHLLLPSTRRRRHRALGFLIATDAQILEMRSHSLLCYKLFPLIPAWRRRTNIHNIRSVQLPLLMDYRPMTGLPGEPDEFLLLRAGYPPRDSYRWYLGYLRPGPNWWLRVLLAYLKDRLRRAEVRSTHGVCHLKYTWPCTGCALFCTRLSEWL